MKNGNEMLQKWLKTVTQTVLLSSNPVVEFVLLSPNNLVVSDWSRGIDSSLLIVFYPGYKTASLPSLSQTTMVSHLETRYARG